MFCLNAQICFSPFISASYSCFQGSVVRKVEWVHQAQWRVPEVLSSNQAKAARKSKWKAVWIQVMNSSIFYVLPLLVSPCCMCTQIVKSVIGYLRNFYSIDTWLCFSFFHDTLLVTIFGNHWLMDCWFWWFLYYTEILLLKVNKQ